jgi:hypothetical protein
MSGYRVDHMSHQIETTWDNPDGTPYTREQAEQRARDIKGVWWFDCEMWPVDRRNNEQGNAA